MRVVLSTYDSRGGVEPLLALAVRLRENGADATLCAPPDCADRAAEVGVRFVAIGGSVRDLVHATPPPTMESVPQRAAEIMARQFAELTPIADGADAILASGLVPSVAAARSVAERLGTRFVVVNYCPIFLPARHNPPVPLPGRPYPPDVADRAALDALEVEGYNALFGAALNANRVAADLAPVDDVRALMFSGETWIAADPVLAPWPEDAAFAAVQTGAWLMRDERPLPYDVQRFLDAGDPPVYAGFGSVRAAPDAADVAIAAARAHGRRVVLSRGWNDLAPVDDGPDCIGVGEVNHQALFRRVAAVVHHGGAGTTATAAAAGAPQVVVPHIGDQPYWAGRVAALGIGAAHDGAAPTAASLAGALEVALAGETQARATAVAGTIGTDGTAVATRLLRDGAR